MSLLQCPVDTPNLWPQLLALILEGLNCDSLQLWWHTPIVDEMTCQIGSLPVPSAEARATLYHYLQLAPIESERQLWPTRAVTLQIQLLEQIAHACAQVGHFQLSQAICFSQENWPSDVEAIFGPCLDSQLLIVPLYFGSDGIGMMAAHRQWDRPPWQADEIRAMTLSGGQIYLAVKRASIDRLAQDYSARDQLTQLPDRMVFGQHLEQALARSLEQDVMLGVAFLDLDRFKNINDTLGHEAGDCLIKQVAERLQRCLRGYDVVARWGGDEFTLLLCNLRSPEDIAHIADRLLGKLATPFLIQDQELYVTASLGIALAPYDGEDAQTLLRNADAAMYQAKARGRNTYQIYFEEINADARSQLNLETDLRKALKNKEFFLCFQPQVNLATSQWIGMEALVRWQHPTLGLISPGRFIPIAEESGLIEPLGQWVLEAACAQYVRWQKAGMPPLQLAVNLSAQQFQRTHLVGTVLNIVSSTGFDPHLLELEVTESAAMTDVNFAIDSLRRLADAGIQIAMDDFGTGYSSLSVLKHFPLDTIKIDRSFVMDLVESPSDAAIAATIVALAKGLNFKVLAEGIETPEQIDVLEEMGCDYAQGYWFSRPLTVAQIDELLKTGELLKLLGT